MTKIQTDMIERQSAEGLIMTDFSQSSELEVIRALRGVPKNIFLLPSVMFLQAKKYPNVAQTEGGILSEPAAAADLSSALAPAPAS